MRLFLDSSVVLAACGRSQGASRAIFDGKDAAGWMLLACPYVFGEVEANIGRLGKHAGRDWQILKAKLRLVPDVLVFDWQVVFASAKDRPILFSAAASADVLLTLDQGDFGDFFGIGFYGLPVMKPGQFLEKQRASGK